MARHASSTNSSIGLTEARASVSDRDGPNAGRRWPRIRSTLLLAVGAILCIWLGIETIRTHRQRAAIRAIWDLGGYVHRRYDGPEDDATIPPWYRRLFGADFKNPVVAVRLAGTVADDEALIHLSRLPHLRLLDLCDTRISDAGIERLQGLNKLTVLVLNGTAVSDKALAPLRQMPNLAVLCVEETRITDEGLQQLRDFPTLGWLNVSGTGVTDIGLGHIRECPRLGVLIAERCIISDACVNEFQRAKPYTQVFVGSSRRPSVAVLRSAG